MSISEASSRSTPWTPPPATHYANEEPENGGEKQVVSTNPGSDTVEFSGLKNERIPGNS